MVRLVCVIRSDARHFFRVSMLSLSQDHKQFWSNSQNSRHSPRYCWRDDEESTWLHFSDFNPTHSWTYFCLVMEVVSYSFHFYVSNQKRKEWVTCLTVSPLRFENSIGCFAFYSKDRTWVRFFFIFYRIVYVSLSHLVSDAFLLIPLFLWYFYRCLLFTRIFCLSMQVTLALHFLYSLVTKAFGVYLSIFSSLTSSIFYLILPLSLLMLHLIWWDKKSRERIFFISGYLDVTSRDRQTDKDRRGLTHTSFEGS
jgi:hypothetical protein